ncbi:MAG: endonuclease/exonuclease/phosphatase family protein [Clostridia bacterium]|nr:endonuclease/exonuclease/phosphatase family protein [Clostridia bacterium]
MKKSRIIAATLVAAIVLTGVGFVIYNKATTVDFGEIIIDGIPEKSEDAKRIMSFNVRYGDDKEGSVKNRSKISIAIIEQYAPDSFGVQEATGRWIDILSEALSEKYAYVGEHRDEDSDSEYSAVFYLKDKFNLLDSGTIWLSDTPEVKYTKYEESACTRIATWATLENKESGEVYTHINTHLDHVSDTARNMQADVLKTKITELESAGDFVVCTGDFNAEPTNEVYTKMLEGMNDAKTIASNSDDGITFHNYGRVKEGSNGPIDYVFTSGNLKVENYKIIRNTAKDMYPSDHYPIIADVIMEDK